MLSMRTGSPDEEAGFAIIAAEGYETIDEVVFAEPSDTVHLGVRTLEGFGVAVDNIAHRLWRRRPLSPPAKWSIPQVPARGAPIDHVCNYVYFSI
jgi:hypothetical protein